MNNENAITIKFNQQFESISRDAEGCYTLSFKDPVIAKDIWNDIREYTKDLLLFVHNPSLLTSVSLLFGRFFNRRKVDKLNREIAIYKSPEILAGIIQKQQQQIRHLKRRLNQKGIKSRRDRSPWWIPELFEELRRARTKFPGNALTLTAFSEEAGEVVKAVLDRMQGKPVDVSAEIIQAMAMCVRLLEEGDRVHVLRADPREPKTWDDRVQRTHARPVPDPVEGTANSAGPVQPAAADLAPDPSGEGSAWSGQP